VGGSESAAFDTGVQAERDRALFALNLRKITGRRLQKRAVGSRDPVAVALLEEEEKQEKQILIEPAAASPQTRALTAEEQAFADTLCRKIARARRYAQRNP
jgi:hypothetical protein